MPRERAISDEVQGTRLSRGDRGAPPADEAAPGDVLLRISGLVSVAAGIQELDVNPVMVSTDGCPIADAGIRIEQARGTYEVDRRVA